MAKIVVLVSGGGSNLQAIIDAIADGTIDTSIAVVIADRVCYGLERAVNNNIPAILLDRKIYRGDLSQEIAKHIPADCQLIVLAGFLSILDTAFIRQFSGKIINIHPSLLPRHGGAGMWGLNVHKAVLTAGDKVSGCTVHYVNSEIDGGNIIAQKQVAVLDGDSAEELQARVLVEEHQLLVSAIADLLTVSPVLEVALLNIIDGQTDEFEQAFCQAASYLQNCHGYIRHELQRCLENSHQYVLLVWWDSLEAHAVGFRQSGGYQEWKNLLHKFYDPFPSVLHYRSVV